MLGRVGSSVGRLGIISANRGPNFSYTGTNAAFQSALTEAAYTGLVAGFSAPAYPQYWLRGVSYPSFLSVPGATYTRTGNRAGLDAAVIYPANVPRIAPSVGPGPELYSGQVGTFDNGAGGATASYNSGTQTVSVTVAGSDAGYPRLRYSLGIVSGRSYRVTGRIDGARTGVNSIRLAISGSANNVAYNSTTGVFDGIVTANGTALEFVFNGTVTGDRTIAALSVQEYRDAGSGLRVHGAGTNLVRASENITIAPWIQNFVNVTGNAVNAPDGSLTADNVVENATTNLHRVGANYPAQAAGLAATFSVFVRPVGSARRLFMNFLAGGNAGALFDFSGAGSVVATSGTAPNLAASITQLAGGWYRCSVLGTTVAVNDLAYLQINQAASVTAADNSYLGDGASGFSFWGAQLEQSSFATDYIPNPNTGASSSAGADDAVLGTAAGVTLGADHAILIEGIVPDLIAGAFPDFIGWSASSSSVGIFVNASGSNLGVAAGGGTINLTGGPTFTKGQVVRALFRVSGGNTGRLFVNGVAAFANTAFTPSTGLTSLFLGQTPAKTSLLSSSLNIAAVLLRAPSDAECLAMTAL